MSTRTGLFAKVLPLFTSNTEQAATAALKYILEQSDSARKALEQKLINARVEVGPLTRFQTEVSGDEHERVDLVCYDEHGAERVLIEAKFWAGLTDNQPNTYFERLPCDSASVLLFIAPYARQRTLWPRLRDRLAAGNISLTDVHTTDFLCSAVDGDGKRHLVLTSWRSLLMDITRQASGAGDKGTEDDVAQLRGLTEREDAHAFLPLHSEELGPQFPRRVLGFRRLVDRATEEAQNLGLIKTDGLRVTPQIYGYGRYIQVSDLVMWFGIDFERWASGNEVPIYLKVELDRQNRDAAKKLFPNAIPRTTSEIQIRLPIGAEESTVLDAVVGELERVAKILAPNSPA